MSELTSPGTVIQTRLLIHLPHNCIIFNHLCIMQNVCFSFYSAGITRKTEQLSKQCILFLFTPHTLGFQLLLTAPFSDLLCHSQINSGVFSEHKHWSRLSFQSNLPKRPRLFLLNIASNHNSSENLRTVHYLSLS